MEISFKKAKLKKQCNDDREAKKQFGTVMAKKLKRRMDDLKAAPTLEEMRNLPGRCHELKGDRDGQLSLDLEGQWRLIFEPAEPYSSKDDGGLDWKTVLNIKVLGVEDTHE